MLGTPDPRRISEALGKFLVALELFSGSGGAFFCFGKVNRLSRKQAQRTTGFRKNDDQDISYCELNASSVNI